MLGDEFRSRVKPYMQKALEKGIPSLFSDLKGLCLVDEKQRIIQSVAEEFKEQYEAKDEGQHPGARFGNIVKTNLPLLRL